MRQRTVLGIAAGTALIGFFVGRLRANPELEAATELRELRRAIEAQADRQPRVVISREPHQLKPGRATETSSQNPPPDIFPVRDGEPETEEPEPTPEAAAAIEAATRLIDVAVSRKTWNEEDLTQFRRLTPHLPPTVHADLVRRLIVRVNRDELRLNVKGPPF